MGARLFSLAMTTVVFLAAGCGGGSSADEERSDPPAAIDSARVDHHDGADDEDPVAADEDPVAADDADLTVAARGDLTTDQHGDEDGDTDGDGDDEDGDTDGDGDEDGDTDDSGDVPPSERGLTAGAGPVALAPVWPRDSGEQVVVLQERLHELGFAPGTPDGSYGGRTVRAVKAFQGLVGLSMTGWADGPTIDELTAYRYDGLVLHSGDEGEEVEAFQKRLAVGPLDPGPPDGEYGGRTIQAVWALEKMAGIPVDGDWGPLDEKAWEDLQAGLIGTPVEHHDQRWVEVDLSEQLMKVYDPGSELPVLVSHASSGSGVPWSNEEHSGSSVTPLGDFHIYNRINGWRESSLDIGRLYNPLYFNGGIALHGATSVPLYPASHGCIRLPMHVADYLPDELPNGTPVHVMA